MIKRLFCQFVRSYTTMDLRTDEETRRVRAERYAKKHKTCGKRAVFTTPEPQGWTLVEA